METSFEKSGFACPLHEVERAFLAEMNKKPMITRTPVETSTRFTTSQDVAPGVHLENPNPQQDQKQTKNLTSQKLESLENPNLEDQRQEFPSPEPSELFSSASNFKYESSFTKRKMHYFEPGSVMGNTVLSKWNIFAQTNK